MQRFRRLAPERARRQGLAPVELVLALPVWMLLASAMLLVGHLGAWKIRGHLAAREAAARGQWPRTRSSDPNPSEWSRPSAILRPLPATGPQIGNPLVGHVVIRGPQLSVPGSPLVLAVNGQAMPAESAALAGEAFLNEPPAIWQKSGLRNRFAREYPSLDGDCGQWAGDRELRAQRVWNLPEFD